MNMNIIVMMVLFGGMMFFMQRQQKKQQAKRQEQLDNMKLGSKIVTIGGLHGVLAGLDTAAGTIDLDCEGVILTFDRSAVKSVTPASSTEDSTDKSEFEEVSQLATAEEISNNVQETKDEITAEAEKDDSPFIG